jgi:hypothetical protein
MPMSKRQWEEPIAEEDAAPVSAGGDALPPPQTRRWVARRKAQVVAAVRDGLLSFEDACHRYSLSAEEFTSWEQAIDRHGVGGLRVTLLDRPGRRTRRP